FQEDANGIRAAASGVSATLSARSASLGESSGSLSLLLNNDNTKVLEAVGTLSFSVAGFANASATSVKVKWNTSATDYSANGASLALTVSGIPGATIDAAPGTLSFAITGLTADNTIFLHVALQISFQEDANGIRAAASGVS